MCICAYMCIYKYIVPIIVIQKKEAIYLKMKETHQRGLRGGT